MQKMLVAKKFAKEVDLCREKYIKFQILQSAKYLSQQNKANN